MKFKRLIMTMSLAGASAMPVAAAEFVYGSWPPASDYLSTDTLPHAFAGIDKDTGGAIKWKLIAGGQLADGKGSFGAVKDGVMDAGLGIPIYVPNLVPALSSIYSTVTPGADVVAVAGALTETMFLNCAECLGEMRKINAIPLGPFASAYYQLICRTPVTSAAGLKGKRVRATGGYGEIVNLAGGTPLSATLTDAVGLLQRGSLDCVIGAADWLKTYGYGDMAKNVTDASFGVTGPAIAFMVSRTAWGKMTREQKIVHLKYSTQISAEHSIGNFVLKNQKTLEEMVATKGVKIVKSDGSFDKLFAEYKVKERERVLASAKGFGVQNMPAYLDAYNRALEKWRGLSKGIGTDVGKFADALWREVMSKVDPDSL